MVLVKPKNPHQMTSFIPQLLKQIGSKNCWSNASFDELHPFLPLQPADNQLYQTLLMSAFYRI
jgi:hypothetical protein